VEGRAERERLLGEDDTGPIARRSATTLRANSSATRIVLQHHLAQWSSGTPPRTGSASSFVSKPSRDPSRPFSSSMTSSPSRRPRRREMVCEACCGGRSFGRECRGGRGEEGGIDEWMKGSESMRKGRNVDG
jgi:hypothetical protein